MRDASPIVHLAATIAILYIIYSHCLYEFGKKLSFANFELFQ